MFPSGYFKKYYSGLIVTLFVTFVAFLKWFFCNLCNLCHYHFLIFPNLPGTILYIPLFYSLIFARFFPICWLVTLNLF